MFMNLRLALSAGDSCPYLKMNQRIREVARCSGVGDIVRLFDDSDLSDVDVTDLRK